MSAPLPETMRAWMVTRYGGPEVLDLRDVPVPRPRRGEILIRVEATTVSSGDRRMRAFDLPRGMALPGRLLLGLARPRRPVLGVELTGLVAEAGAGAPFGPGEPVIASTGMRAGAHAEYCLIRAGGAVARRPQGMELTVAAALAFGGMTAMDYLRRARLARGERVLVIGASGTVGSALVQLASAAGARVSAVTSAANHDFVLGLGASEAIDYRRRDVAREEATYDIVADAVGALDFARALPILAAGGRYLAIAGGLGDMLARRRGSRRPIAGPATERREDLESLVAIVGSGTFRPPVDCVLPFTRLPEAHARVDSGRKRGSVVVTVP